MARGHRARPFAVWHSLPQADESDVDLQEDWQSARGSTAPGHTKIESTVRYLGIEVDDAIAIAELRSDQKRGRAARLCPFPNVR
jgi:hypothetical protein